MALSSPPLVDYQAPPYDFDVAYPGIVIETYRNDPLYQYNDCVIAARAHQTIRFDYRPGIPISISADDVAAEYFQENGGSTTDGVNLESSLQQWIDPGWTAAHTTRRTIAGYYGPLAIKDAPLFSADFPLQADTPALMSYIHGYTGVQVDLRLPDSIDVRSVGTYGPGTIWKSTAELPVEPHVMLLTGYTDNGPIGITWGKKQAMTWDFLRSYCCGVYVISKGPDA